MGALLVSSLQWERFTGGTVRSWNDDAGKIKLSWSAFSLTLLSLTIQPTSSDIRAPSIRILLYCGACVLTRSSSPACGVPVPGLTTAASCAEARAVLEAQGFRVEYVEERWARRLAAVNLEGVRLIDNVPVAETAILGLTIQTSPSTQD